jgi:hypothetical protein
MSRLKITITLTRPQFIALSAAVAAREAELENGQELATLDRAWSALCTAWSSRRVTS